MCSKYEIQTEFIESFKNTDESENNKATSSFQTNDEQTIRDNSYKNDDDGPEKSKNYNNEMRPSLLDDTDAEVQEDIEKAPDGGWGWLIVFGCILMRLLVGGIIRSRGIVFRKIMDRFNGSATSTALISSLATFLRLMIGPIVSILTNRFSCRTLSSFGTLIMTLGLLLSAFAPNQTFLYFSFGILSGIGRGFVLTPVPILLGSYFDKRRSRAFGLASTGFSIGGFAISPTVEVLFQTYGFQGAFIILAGLCIQILVAAALFRPITLHRKITAKSRKTKKENTESVVLKDLQSIGEEDGLGSSLSLTILNNKTDDGPFSKRHHKIDESKNSEPLLEQKPDKVSKKSINGSMKMDQNKNKQVGISKKKKKLIDLSILKDVRYVCFVLATICFTLPSTGLFLPSLAIDRGVSEIKAATLISVTAGFDTVFRVISGFVLDMKPFRTIRPEIFNIMTFFQAVTLALYPLLHTYEHIFVVCAIQGSLQGIKTAQGSVIVMDMLGVDKLASSMAITMTGQGLSVFLGPTISGQLKDHYGTYDGAFYFGAVATFVGAIIMAFGQIRKRYKDSKNTKARANISNENT